MRRASRLLLAFTALACAAIMTACVAQPSEPETEPETLAVTDEPYRWVMNYKEDCQYPELPTGCEATAASTAMRMAGIPVSKLQVADRMPKSDSDFVHAFLGDPYSESGWACAAPCVVQTVNSFLDIEEKYAAVELTGTPLAELPNPCVIWVTIELVPPEPPVRESEGYGLYRNSHCIVLQRIEGEQVYVIDPLGGDTVYPLEKVEVAYDGLGRQAVYVCEIGEAVRIINERGVG